MLLLACQHIAYCPAKTCVTNIKPGVWLTRSYCCDAQRRHPTAATLAAHKSHIYSHVMQWEVETHVDAYAPSLTRCVPHCGTKAMSTMSPTVQQQSNSSVPIVQVYSSW